MLMRWRVVLLAEDRVARRDRRRRCRAPRPFEERQVGVGRRVRPREREFEIDERVVVRGRHITAGGGEVGVVGFVVVGTSDLVVPRTIPGPQLAVTLPAVPVLDIH